MKHSKDIKIVKHTSNHGMLIIKPVEKSLAKEMIIKNHYSRKWVTQFGLYNYGIFRAEEEDKCLGVASYGYRKAHNARDWEHPNPEAVMYELNRMWVSDELGHNAETILIGNSLKLLRKQAPNCVAVQSFADGRLGCGTIYKASNFKYYGFHYTMFAEEKVTGEITHEQLFTNTTNRTGYLLWNIKLLLGRCRFFRVKTYRYIYPLCPKFKSKLKGKPYPAYEKGETPYQPKYNKELIKERLVRKILDL